MKIYNELCDIKLNINDEDVGVQVRPSDTLLYVLREKFGLVGTKSGCENGDCGACTVIVDMLPVKSCLILAVEMEGKKIITIEGLQNTKIQKAFIKHNGFQCGFCTSGFICNAYALLQNIPKPSEEQIKDWLSSNICRCTGYEGIINAINEAIKE